MKFTVIGLKHEAALVRGIAKELGVNPQLVTPKKYKAGEWAVFSPADIKERVVVAGNVWEDPIETFQLSLLLKAVHVAGAKDGTLIAPWFAYGRQDRSVKKGEAPAGRVIADLILSTEVNKVVTLDAHSKRFQDFFKGKMVNILPTDYAAEFARRKNITAVAAPDMGARDRARLLSGKLRSPFIQIKKDRLGPGKVVSRIASGKPKGEDVLLVDDIADTGDTLFKAAAALKDGGARSVSAYLSHTTDLKKFRAQAKKHGITHVEAAFDHKSRKFSVPFKLLVSKGF
ncbi:ribose-phosphate diphosphokinase [Patescibacteria group bacterium]|nr:ribose-phosphate diphosphokinase [Patescibacteria group bacterium]